jgi:hypothetical protein
MKSLYCIKYKSPYDDKFYWLYKNHSSFCANQLTNIKNTQLHLELLNTIKPFDSPDDAYASIREFMDYSNNDWYELKNMLYLGSTYSPSSMNLVDFVLVDVTHDFKEINKFKIKDIDYLFLLTSSFDSLLAEKYSTEKTSKFAKEAFKRSCYAIEYYKDIKIKRGLVSSLYKDFLDVKGLSSNADVKSNITQLHPKKKKNIMVINL